MKRLNIHKSTYVFLLTLIGVFCFNHTSAQATTSTINIENESINEYESSNLAIKYNNISYTSKLSSIKVNSVWMISGKEFFGDILGCYYEVNSKSEEILIKNPDRTKKIGLTKNSKTALVNNSNQTMPQPVFKVNEQDNAENEPEDYYIPLEFTLKALGYSYTLNNTNLTITSNYIYTITTNDVSFNQTKYENAFEGITVGKNSSKTQNYVMGITAEPAYSSDIEYITNSSENSVTMKFLRTKNSFGTISKELNTGIISSIKLWSEDTTTYLKVYYNKKYIYTQKTSANGGRVTLSKGSYSMKILLPDNVSFSKITTTDQYWKKKFLIIVPGNRIDFYKQNAPIKNSSAIKSYTIKKTASGNTQIAITTSGLKGYKLQKGNGYFTIKVGSPKSIYKNIVLLDAGHGGKDRGASKKGAIEKKLNLNIIYKYAKKYFESTTSTVKAYWTRHNDTFINLYTRPKYSKKYSADLFVSLHMNKAPSSRAKGIEVYYSSANKKKMSGLNSRMFASRMCNTLVKDLKSKNRGVKQAGFVVTKYNTVPAILIELGFLSNSSDRTKLKRASYQKKAAKSIYRGIVNTFKAYPSK